ncbi:MAG: bifunctional diguanylate cyclase/phosphodiesterase [Acidobacteria bacterium]|nr:bifunctional diguanylate cyclase/phosphodiesterase [Acidobacteriota bacterium]
MDRKDKYINLFTAILLPLALFALGWAFAGNPIARIDAGVITLTVLTIFCSCFLRIQLPRINIHLTISDALVIIAMIKYGGEIALLIAMLDSAIASLNLRRRASRSETRTIAINTMVAAVGVLITSQIVLFIFGPTDVILERHELTGFVWLLVVMALSLFVVNSVAASVFSAIKEERSFLDVWTKNCVDALVMYLSGAFMEGLILKALEQVNIFLFAAVVVFFGIMYLTFRHFVNDVRKTSEYAKKSERERAEQAEKHVRELEHYVEELERSSSALQESHENFRHAAYHDALTGLPNRNFFIDKLKDLLVQSRENSEVNFAVLLLDLNRFKTINDSLGHSIGDRLIKNVAKRLTNMVREEDMVGRFSGDKFGIILTDLLMKDEATAFSERLAKRIAEPYTLDGRQVFTNVKIGIAFGNSKYAEAEDILRDADIAMYYAKDHNENHVIFDQKMHIRAVTRLQLETDLRFAIERKEFELYYQPIIGLETASLVGFEALVRWNHPQRGLVPPNEFIPISESTGLIIPMTIQILHSACNQVVAWQKERQGETPLSVAVNLSGKHFAHPDLVQQIQDVLDQTGIAPSSLKLELTESAIMENAETAILMLKQIKETGVQISIDDFGTGYSSLSYLQRFPIDLLKVDRSFVSAMEGNTENGEIVRTVIALAKALNLKVVAEGIESIHQYHQLRILGCEYGQGYLFSKPLKVEDINRLLEDKTRWQNILPPAPGMIPQNPNISHLRLAQ